MNKLDNQLFPVNFNCNLTACSLSHDEAREKISSELRRIADILDNGDCFGETGNLYLSDFGKWNINDPWEDNELNKNESNQLTLNFPSELTKFPSILRTN